MMALGTEPHKKMHTVVALRASTGKVYGELTVPASEPGCERLLARAHGLTSERRFAIEECRHVSGCLDRLLTDAQKAAGVARSALLTHRALLGAGTDPSGPGWRGPPGAVYVSPSPCVACAWDVPESSIKGSLWSKGG